MQHCNKVFKTHYKDFMLVANLMLENDDENRIKDLRDIPYIKESKNPYEFLLAIILQNAFHKENKNRVEAVKEKKYLGILTDKKAS